MSFFPALPDLHAIRSRIADGRTTAADEIEHAIQAARHPAIAPAFTQTAFDRARDEADRGAGLPLAGLAVSVKDLFDIEGEVTRAGSVVLQGQPPARADAVAVARLRAAGAAIIGRTHMTEFAFSGVGVNPHHAPLAGLADPLVPRIPGGSSSGAGVSVAGGAAFIGLGSDTGGSIRIPAALHGLVGFKSTARLVPTTGALPLSMTLDTVCAITRSARDAVLAHEILAARPVTRSSRPLAERRFAVARTVMLEGMDADVARAFERALGRLRDAGARIEEMAFDEIGELAALQAAGTIAAAESHAWHRPWLARAAEAYDPRVRSRIERGSAMLAADYIDLQAGRSLWIDAMQARLAGFDAVLSPTVPIVAPPLASVAPGAERDDEFFRINGLMLRNPSVVNMLDGCAISLPCHAPGDLPCGLMLWHAARHDDEILSMALQAEPLLQSA